MLDLIGSIVGLTLTLMILSYVIGDNPLYRIATHIFIGATAGYITLIVYFTVFQPQVVTPIVEAFKGGFSVDKLGLLIGPLVGIGLCLLLLARIVKELAGIGNIAVAYLVGVGAAVAVGGAITGTLFPQVGATFFDFRVVFAQPDTGAMIEKFFEYGVITVGTLVTVGAFYYGARRMPGNRVDRPLVAKIVTVLGHIIIGITFAVIYAGAISAGLAFLSERLLAIVEVFQSFMQ